jgi:acyl carrier protein
MAPTTAHEAIAAALAAIAPDVDLAACDPGAPFAEQTDLDSMDVLSLLGELADRTGVEIPDGALAAGWTLDDLVRLLGDRVG